MNLSLYIVVISYRFVIIMYNHFCVKYGAFCVVAFSMLFVVKKWKYINQFHLYIVLMRGKKQILGDISIYGT